MQEEITLEELVGFEIEKFRERAHDEENQYLAMGDFETLELLLRISSELALKSQRIEELEARVRELESQNSLLLDDVQGIAEAVIPYSDASDFAYAVKRDCAETLKAIATKG